MKENKEVTPQLFNMALKCCGVGLDLKTVDIVLQVARVIIEKGDQFSLKDAAQITVEVKDRNP